MSARGRCRPTRADGQLYFCFDAPEPAASARPQAPPPSAPCGDNERLLALQRRYLHGEQAAWGLLWELVVTVARRMVCGECARKGLRLDADEKALDAAIYLLRRYKRGGWSVRSNYISAIKSAVLHALYYRTKADKCERAALKLAQQGVEYGTALSMAKKEIG